MCILNTHTPYIHRPKHQDPNHTKSPPARGDDRPEAKTDARGGGREDLISPANDERDATHLSGELNTSLPGERGSKALPRRPMRDDAGSDPSARDAARGVIGLSAFANNRKGDARSADTCAERRRSIDPASSVCDHTNETKKIFTNSPPRPRSGNPFADVVAARDVENPPPTSSSSRTNKHRKTRGKTSRLSVSSSSSHARHPSVAPVVPASSPRRRRRSSRRFAPRSHPRPRSPRVASRVVARTSSRVALASRPVLPSFRAVLSRVSERFPIVRTTT